ncbi:Sapep family Mn(2+)-dependent dipeptidase [Halalkalibacillus halophilus]|uniref:Sapep family Mn(2+)-dependent dipeptidase n=1 Tax=Halalkalibacillus halophilus TaxID=392827 RepID=UPI000412D927|nr:Sapep family Mn(2+)-dependent dipeptidase [Halalkalibacillus halophilus]
MGSVNESTFEAYLSDLKNLIRIPSVKGEPSLGAPYGKEVSRALCYFLQLAERFGFQAYELDHKVGVIEFGEGEEELAIFVHVDVVPAEDEASWMFSPFSATEHDGNFYGRGTLDDKGPALAVLYALAALKQKGFVPERRIRIVVGGDEESGMDCIKTYKEKESPPTLGFTPDGYFPVTYSEKGILVLEVSLPLAGAGHQLQLHAGKAQNVKPTQASGRLILKERVNTSRILEERVEHVYAPTTTGEWALALQTNSEADREAVIFDMLRAVSHSLTQLDPQASKALISVCNLFSEESGKELGIELEDEESGELTMQTTKMRFDGGILTLTLNIRYPSSANSSPIEKFIHRKLLDHGYEVKTIDHKPPINFDKEDSFIHSLMTLYEQATGRKDEPKSISGGTYARAYPDRVVAFGALFPGEPLNAHAVDEHVKLSVMKEWLHVYEQAIEKIAKGEITP